MYTYKVQKSNGEYGLIVTRNPEASCSRNGSILIGPCEGPKEDEMLDQTTGEIVKRPIVEPAPTLESQIVDLKKRIEALEGKAELRT